MTANVIMTGKQFCQLITGATKFPSIGSFGGSEMVNLKVTKGNAMCTALGVVLSRAVIPVEGELPLIAIDERLIVPFAVQHQDATKVFIDVNDNEICIRARGRKITSPFKEGVEQRFPKIDTEGIAITPMLAERVGYLANVAFSDLSRPDLCCVMIVPDGRAMACNSRAIVVLKCHNGHAIKIAMPLPLAKTLEKGNTIFPGAKETIIKNGYARYCMPSPTAALTDFPVDAIDSYFMHGRDPVAVFRGAQIARAVTEANGCMGALSKLEMVLRLTIANGKVSLTTENGSVRFQTKMTAVKLSVDDAELNLPMEEMLRISPFLATEDRVSVMLGRENGAAFLKFKNGWALFPKWVKNNGG